MRMHHKKKQRGKRVHLVVSLGLALLLALLVSSGSESQSPSADRETSGVPAGQTATLLPNGRFLIIGGESPTGPLASASLWDPRTQSSVPFDDKLLYPRAFHTATLLPDGTVLVLGGDDAGNMTVDRAERFNWERERFQTLPPTGLTPRAHHTATLLTDGRLLVAGGVTHGARLAPQAELWDPNRNSTEILAASLMIPRRGHTATLLPNGHVLLWGGVDQSGQALDNGEEYDPITQKFVLVETPLPPPPSPDTQPPSLADAFPQDGAAEVAPEATLALRFSEPMRVETVHTGSVVLSDSDGTIAARVIPAENGMLAFITPQRPLQLGTVYTITISGATDRAGLEITKATLRFTVGEATSSLLGDDEAWRPAHLQNWRRGDRESSWQSLPPLQAAPGVTALSGQVLTLNGRPLAGVTLEVEGQAVQTDHTGRFLLANIPSGQKVMVIDGKTANRPGKTYGLFEVGVDVISGRTNVLSYTIWMPVIDTAHAVRIPSAASTETIVTTPLIPGLKVIIPPKTIIRDRDGKVVTSLSITPLPVDRPPFPLPGEFPMYFTIQPGGAHVETLSSDIPHGIRVIYPNYRNFPRGMRVDFWNYEPDGTGWYPYGQGTVTGNGLEISPDQGVAIYKLTGTSFLEHFGPKSIPPAVGPAGGNWGGDPVDLYTGLFVLEKTDLLLPDVLPIALTRTYRQGDTRSLAFGIGSSHPYAMYLYASMLSDYQYADLILPDGGRIHYVRTSPGTGHTDAVLEHTATPTQFHKSEMRWNGKGWDLKFKDGSLWVFGDGASLQSMQDRYGNKITIFHANEQKGNITRVVSPNERFIDFTYDASNRIIEAKDNIGRTVSYTYDAGGRLASVTDPNNGTTEYTYNASHQMLTIEDARGIVFLTNAYDANGRVFLQTQADNTTYQFVYTTGSNGKVIQTDLTDPRGIVRRVTFNADGYALTDTYALGLPEQQTTTYNRQAGTNLVLSMTDALNRVTSYTYDPMGNRTSVTRLSGTPEAVTTTFTYEPAFNKVASVTDPLDHTTTYDYDDNGNLISVTDPLNHQTTLTYHPNGQPSSIKNHLNHTTQFSYELGDLTSVTDPLGNITTRLYDNAGRLLNLTNPLGHITAYAYDPLNRVTSIADPLGGATAFSYDPNGNLLTVTDARNNVTTYAYNNMDLLQSRQDPLLLTESYLYDNNANLETFTDRKSQATGFTYDALNRRTGVTYADASTVTDTYDAGNRVTQIVDSLFGTITRTYDNLDRLTSETTPQGTVSYTYDDASRRSSMTVAGQPTVNYTYDDANRLTQITQGTSVVTLSYDAANRRTSTTLPNGIVVEYTYDPASRVTAIDYKQGTTVLGNLTYQYDVNGNRTQIGGSWGRTGLPQALSSAIYNAANQMTAFGSQTLTYDNNGNLINDGATNFGWDARNRLISMTGTGMNANFQYDSIGRRATKTINGISTGFLYNGQTPIQELSGTTPTANLLTGLGIDEYITRTDSAGTRTLLTDVLGSTLALSDDIGTAQTQYTYEPFGRTSATGQNNSNPFQYTGRENDGTGFYYYRARYYGPELGRFFSEDPLYSPMYNAMKCRGNFAPDVSQLIEIDRNLAPLMRFGFYDSITAYGSNPQHLQMYVYTNNNPLNNVDSTGLRAGPQSPGCDIYGNVPGFPQSSCAKKCCNDHDDCYINANSWCDATTWIDPTASFRRPDCLRCNRTVVECLARNRPTNGRKPCK